MFEYELQVFIIRTIFCPTNIKRRPYMATTLHSGSMVLIIITATFTLLKDKPQHMP